ncbi:hypothetical protein FAUST_3743 [Fusarium austroamericanum]|uniref:MYND-type zinc finger protein samB n=1 Tax=Fusarium austroamericanum TaxID=282268 RepID=A0AAN6C485_FUSAU|nr:hypothetical protein FAUST_3743 [Fusarium austroamericanum]
MTDNNLFVVRDVPLKGKGLIATTKIPKGTRIIAESPLIKVPRECFSDDLLRQSVIKELSKLSQDQRASFYSLLNSHPKWGEEVGIVATNGLCAGPDQDDSAVFLTTSRINHSCKPNAQNRWNQDLGKVTIHAVEDIEQGQEITITYLGNPEVYEERQKKLKNAFGFDCCCRLCSLSPAERDLDDKLIKEIDHLQEDLENEDSILESPIRCLDRIYKVVSQLEAQGVGTSLIPTLFASAMGVAVAHSDLARAKVFAQLSLKVCIISEGHDTPWIKNLKALTEDPSRHEHYGLTDRFASTIKDIPKDKGPVAFKDWLWMSLHGQLANLRNIMSFPYFKGIDGLPRDWEPNYNDVIPRCMTETDSESQKHWAFLGEITHIEAAWRVRLIVKDKTGLQLPIAFYTEIRGREIGASMLRVGYTVAILYASQHGFLDGTVGIRHEDPGRLRILPTSLENLLLLNDKVQAYSVVHNQTRACHGCNKKSDSLKKCSKCGFFWYCNQDCQTRGWNENSHKADCRILKNEDVKGLFLVKWGEFETHMSFPLSV